MPCPICEELFAIPAEGFDAFQTDFFLSRLTEPLETGSSSCAQILSRVLEARTCDLHPMVKLTSYCSDCDKVLCDACFDECHQNHRLQRTKNAAENFREEFKNRRLSVTKTEALKRIEELSQSKLKLGGNTTKLRENVQKRRENIEELLGKHTRLLLQDVDSEELRLFSEHESLSKDYELHLANLKSFDIYCGEIMARGSPDDVCCAMTNLKRRAGELATKQDSLKRLKSPQYSLDFREADLEEFFDDEFNIIGTIPGETTF